MSLQLFYCNFSDNNRKIAAVKEMGFRDIIFKNQIFSYEGVGSNQCIYIKACQVVALCLKFYPYKSFRAYAC